MSCGSQWNLRIACTWHSALYLITVLTIQKATSLPSQLQVFKKTFPTKSFILSDPLTPHSPRHNSCLISHSAVCPALPPGLFNLIVFSLRVLLTHCSYRQLNFRSSNSSRIVFAPSPPPKTPRCCARRLTLLTPLSHPQSLKRATALIQSSLACRLQSQLCPLGISAELAAAIHWIGNVKIWLQSEHWMTSATWRMWTWDRMRWWAKMLVNRWWRTRGTNIANNACACWRQGYLR